MRYSKRNDESEQGEQGQPAEKAETDEEKAARAAAEKQAALTRRSLQLLSETWRRNQENAGGGVILDRDQAAALYAHVCKLEGKEPA